MRTRTRITCALTAALLVGCSVEPSPRQVERPVAATKTTPLEDVAGTLDGVTVTDLSIVGSGLYPDGSAADARTPVDQDAVDTLVAAAVRWLDVHLTQVQAGGEGQVASTDLTGDPTAVSSAFANPVHRVTSADYTATVGVLGTPEWIRMTAVVDREDGRMSATFVFLPAGDEVTLLAVHAGEGTPAPPAEPASSGEDGS